MCDGPGKIGFEDADGTESAGNPGGGNSAEVAKAQVTPELRDREWCWNRRAQVAPRSLCCTSTAAEHGRWFKKKRSGVGRQANGVHEKLNREFGTVPMEASPRFTRRAVQ